MEYWHWYSSLCIQDESNCFSNISDTKKIQADMQIQILKSETKILLKNFESSANTNLLLYYKASLKSKMLI